MKKKHFWLEIVMIVAGVACVLALLFACLGAVAAVAGEPKPPQTAQAAEAQVQEHQVPEHLVSEHQVSEHLVPEHAHIYEGMVTCSRCGARHSAAFGRTAADCSRVCVHGGSQFALVEGEKTYLLDGDVTALKSAAGQRARIVGVARGNTITVSSVAAAT